MSDVLAVCENDGYTERGYIKTEARLYPAVRFTFRPLLPEERALLMSENAKLSAAQSTRNTCRVLAAKLKTWDVKNSQGEVLPVKAEVIGTLKPAMYERLLAIVLGLDAPDEDPDAPATPEDKTVGLADLLEAQAKEVPVGDVAQERQGKN